MACAVNGISHLEICRGQDEVRGTHCAMIVLHGLGRVDRAESACAVGGSEG